MPLFDINSPKETLRSFLADKGWISPGESIVHIEKPGEGNMNVVLRIKTNEQSMILKQSRPYVQKFPHLAAPIDRIDTEKLFYESISGLTIHNHFPEILYYSKTDHTLILEDLGDCEDMTSIYGSRSISDADLTVLANILNQIHSVKASSTFPQNIALRKLNHQHIFILPFLEDNGFDLDQVHSGLQAIGSRIKKDIRLKRMAIRLGDIYLAAGNTLIHGDFYPGSWMRQGQKLYVLDPEFSFLGFPEFDLGVMTAHIILATGDSAYLSRILGYYEGNLDMTLTRQITGIEIIRRLIGLAQLPLKRSLDEKEDLLYTARNLMLL